MFARSATSRSPLTTLLTQIMSYPSLREERAAAFGLLIGAATVLAGRHLIRLAKWHARPSQ